MATRDTAQGGGGISRRDFLKATAATAAVGCGLDIAYDPEKALAYEVSDDYNVTTTTCPYCSASCGQRVVTSVATGEVVDLYGDFQSPMNTGGLCSKGAGSFQLVTNERRIGAWQGTHPVPNIDGTMDNVFAADGTTNGVAYRRIGSGNWAPMDLQDAFDEIAGRMVSARGKLHLPGLRPVFTSGETINSQVYTGFSGLATVKKADGTYFVTTNGNKVNEATLLSHLANPAALLADFDSLVFTATEPTDRSSYTLVGISNLGTVLLGAGVLANTGDLVRDGANYFFYGVDAVTGEMHRAVSTDMLAWTYQANLGKPVGVGAMTSPSVLKSGSSLKVWYVNTTAQKLQYAEYDGAAWNAAVNVTVGGSDPIWFVGHPVVTSSATTFTLQYVLGSGGIRKATAPIATPAVFGASSAVYDNVAKSEGNVSVGGNGIAFTTYAQPDPNDTGWAYSDVVGYVNADGANNSKSVAFFGSSHINNEPNNLYRKIVANFGTSNVEHQARI